MSIIFTIIFIASAVGIWYFWTKNPNKKKLIASIIILVLSAILIATTSGDDSKSSTDSSNQVSTKKGSTKKITELEQATIDVDALFSNSKHTKLLSGTTEETIASVKKEVSTLKSSKKKTQLNRDILKAEKLWPAFKETSIKNSASESVKLASESTVRASESASESSKLVAESESSVRAESESQAAVAAEKAKEKDPASYQSGITYDQVARTPDDYLGKKIYFTGRVLQVMEDDGETQIRLAVDGNYDNVLLIDINKSDLAGSRILEDDLVNAAGYSNGIISYKSTMSGKISIPSMSAKVIENQGAASDDYGY